MAKSALSKVCDVSEDLADIIGKDSAPRTEITRLVWVYIKKNGLQHPQHKRIIEPDELLSRVIGNKSIDMMKMTAKVSKHIFPRD